MASGCVWRRSCRSHHRQLVVLVIVSLVLSLGWGGGSNGGGRGTGWVALADEATATPSASSDDSGKADGEATVTADGTAAAAEPVQHAPSAALCATPSRANNIDKCQATQRCAWVVGVGCVKAHFASQGMHAPTRLPLLMMPHHNPRHTQQLG